MRPTPVNIFSRSPVAALACGLVGFISLEAPAQEAVVRAERLGLHEGKLVVVEPGPSTNWWQLYRSTDSKSWELIEAMRGSLDGDSPFLPLKPVSDYPTFFFKASRMDADQHPISSIYGAYTKHVGHPFLLYNGVIYGAIIKSDGSTDVDAFSYDTTTGALDMAKVESSTQDDDHNNGNIVIDPVNDVLVVVQTDHNSRSQPLQLFRGTDLGPASLPTANPTSNLRMNSQSYSSSFINPHDLDQVDIICREAGYRGSQWRLVRTEDLTARAKLIQYDLMEDHYLDARVEHGNSGGIWLICHGDPSAPEGPHYNENNQPQAIALWHLDRDTDTLSTGGMRCARFRLHRIAGNWFAGCATARSSKSCTNSFSRKDRFTSRRATSGKR